MTATFTPNPIVKRAREILQQLGAADREYAEYCADMHRQGYGPQWCRHGSNLWSDYDVFCSGCEDSRTNREKALDQARYESDKAQAAEHRKSARVELAMRAIELGFGHAVIAAMVAELNEN